MIRNYNINTGQCTFARREKKLISLCLLPSGSILVLSRAPGFVIVGVHGITNKCYPYPADNKPCNPPHTNLSMFHWEEEQQQFRFNHSQKNENKFLQKCYHVKHFDMLVVICENKTIEALEFGNHTTIWKLPTVVDGHTVKPDAITSDKLGNVYIGDGQNNRILKINGRTGDVISILLLEQSGKVILSLFWSDSEPNLTMIRTESAPTARQSFIEEVKE